MLLVRVQVHRLLFLVPPAHDERLSRPAAARPKALAIALGELARLRTPAHAQLAFPNLRRPKGGAAAQLVAAEGHDALPPGVGRILRNRDRLATHIGFRALSVDLQFGGDPVRLGLRLRHGMRRGVARFSLRAEAL